MSDILYVQTEKNVKIVSSQVYLQDIAKLACANSKVLNRNRVRKITTLPENKPGRYVISVMDIIEEIQKQEENVDVTHIGEPSMVLTYETQNQPAKWKTWLKTAMVCVLTFFGAAFSIMTFNIDVDASGLFYQLYRQFTGEISNGRTILELSYSIGIGIGVIAFFNHFGPGKLTQDPTPMEVEMRQYEDEVDTTVIEAMSRKEKQ
ncbi:MAG: stage V sporulation protein AA [Lachnospiraceae bacterium]